MAKSVLRLQLPRRPLSRCNVARASGVVTHELRHSTSYVRYELRYMLLYYDYVSGISSLDMMAFRRTIIIVSRNAIIILRNILLLVNEQLEWRAFMHLWTLIILDVPSRGMKNAMFYKKSRLIFGKAVFPSQYVNQPWFIIIFTPMSRNTLLKLQSNYTNFLPIEYINLKMACAKWRLYFAQDSLC